MFKFSAKDIYNFKFCLSKKCLESSKNNLLVIVL